MTLQEATVAALEENIVTLQRVLRRLTVASMRPGRPGAALQTVMRMIAESGECRARDLCTDLGVGAPVLSRHIADLEERRLAVRRPDPKDGRSQLITLTPAGFAELQEAGDNRSVLLRSALASWPETEARNTSEVLGQLSRTLNTYLREHPDPTPPPQNLSGK
ncbi:MarR family winged helix-turn-helix transcriptional regulator [Pseudarthrobacter oxydans]|jgi:DNA-binding MarR family transcriptional regulator|uniref:MarR family winged helix-turn-helix transcriptional regulator n=1 Tax=Pseudarthrobacter TaxID=1742993 RepID=UPI000CEB888B|nr:MarR family winged helix-turn-helix transcriptional regulator [Pseudarthrobacter sp. NCCP-2145]MBD1539586.1 winged helix-turn-helix transcriptional regulator [Arthrobacter sp. S13_S34]GKV73744.1 hypothetical protein NCCP2145_31250 [Pseudarthrobacter sp. NCCP-2145]